MTVAEMHTAVKILVDKIDSLAYPNLEDNEIDFFLNKEMERFIKHRADGALAKNRGFEETQKRMDDLRNITKHIALTADAATSSNKPNSYFVTLPSTVSDTYWFAVNEEVTLIKKDCDGIEINSGDITTGTQYIVTEGTVTYHDIVYTEGQTFTGITGDVNGSPYELNTYIGTGTVYETEIVRAEVKPLQHDDYNKTIKDPFNKPVVNSQFKQVRRMQLAGQMEIILPDGDYYISEYILRYIN